MKLSALFMTPFFLLILVTSGCGTYEDPIQPTRHQIENVDRNSGNQDDWDFPVDPSIRYDDESINPDIPQKDPPDDPSLIEMKKK